MNRDVWLSFRWVVALAPLSVSIVVAAENFYFDKGLLLGNSLSQENIDFLMRQDGVLPGAYSLDIYVNDVFVSRSNVDLVKDNRTGEVVPCLLEEFYVEKVGAKKLDEDVSGGGGRALLSVFEEHSNGKGGESYGENDCIYIRDRLEGSEYALDISKLELRITAPRDSLDVKPIGYVSPDDWDEGELMGFLSYDASYYRSNYKGESSLKTDFGFVSVSAGVNLGLWRFRHISNFSYRDFSGAKESKWNNLRNYLQRSIPEIESELTIGDAYTRSSMFSGISYRGASLFTDERMLAYSRLNYAPEVRGVATTTARVVISQNGRVVRELTVKPGVFVVDDLYDTASAGDLEVKVVEADGSVSEFIVPYAAVPQSIRPGNSRYSLDVGEMRDYGSDSYFADVTYERGISNAVTASGGLRVANDYVAVAGGGVLATQLGAFGFNAVFSHADEFQGGKQSGWRFGVNYSKTFQDTNTNISLAGYRYSTKGFRELSDVVARRDSVEDGYSWNSYTYQQRNQLTLSVSQSLGAYGSVYVSGSASDYYDGKSKNTNVQIGYANVWKGISYSIAVARQNSYFYNELFADGLERNQLIFDYKSNPYNSIMLSFSVPLGSSARSPSLNTQVTRSTGKQSNTIIQTGMAGTLLEDNSLGYSINAGRDNNLKQNSFSGTVSKLTSVARIGAGYATGDYYDQYNASISGGVVAHSGGLTFGQYLGDTFALVEVPDGGGAIIRTSNGVRVGDSGYAVVGNLAPYRYNSIIVEPGDISYTAELIETEKKVAPYAGASVRVKFDTVQGYPLLIVGSYPDGTPLPMGASVFNSEDVSIGMVGQGGQVYARVAELEGVLKVGVQVDDLSNCHIRYKIDKEEVSVEGLVAVRKREVCEF